MPHSLELQVNLGVHPRDIPVTELNGPGRRLPIWTQGCAHRCTEDCISPQLLAVRPRYLLSVGEVLAVLNERACREGQRIEGITLLGGEPTEQAMPLSFIASGVREWGWTVMTYSGHTLKRLQSRGDPGINRLLQNTDILVDGPFVKRLANPLLRWRGSTNQRIIFLSDTYSSSGVESTPVIKGVDITLTTDGRLLVSGSQSKSFVAHLASALQESGLIADRLADGPNTNGSPTSS